MEHPFRLVEAEVEENGKRLYSNVWELSAMEIASVYRYRWDIEVFFRFMKQELNVKHLINRSKNGIQIQLYTSLIAAILLTVFKINEIKSFKIAKLKFEEELLLLLMKNHASLKPT